MSCVVLRALWWRAWNMAAYCRGEATRHVTTFPSSCFEWLVEAGLKCHNIERNKLLRQEIWSFVVGECVWRHCSAWIQERGETPMFHLQSQWSPETHLIPCVARENLQRGNPLFVLWSFVNILDTQCAQKFLYHTFFVTASWIVVLGTSGMIWCDSFIFTLPFARIYSSNSWRRT